MHQQVEVTLKMTMWLDARLDEEDIGELVRGGIYSQFPQELTPILPESRLDILAIRQEHELYNPEDV
jgi:hypothetical protein